MLSGTPFFVKNLWRGPFDKGDRSLSLGESWICSRWKCNCSWESWGRIHPEHFVGCWFTSKWSSLNGSWFRRASILGKYRIRSFKFIRWNSSFFHIYTPRIIDHQPCKLDPIVFFGVQIILLGEKIVCCRTYGWAIRGLIDFRRWSWSWSVVHETFFQGDESGGKVHTKICSPPHSLGSRTLPLLENTVTFTLGFFWVGNTET